MYEGTILLARYFEFRRTCVHPSSDSRFDAGCEETLKGVTLLATPTEPAGLLLPKLNAVGLNAVAEGPCACAEVLLGHGVETAEVVPLSSNDEAESRLLLF